MHLLFFLLSVLTLGQQLKKAEPGDYLVTSQGRCYTVLLVREIDDKRILIDEITIPEAVRPRGTPWHRWVQQGGRNATAWITYSLDLNSARTIRSYSHTRRTWLDNQDSFLTTLLRLKFEPIPADQRKKAGSGKEWRPALTFEGRKVKNVAFTPYRATWPKDSTPLSGHLITIYLLKEEGPFPAHFPYWTELTPSLPDSTVRVVDSGNNLSSPKHVAF